MLCPTAASLQLHSLLASTVCACCVATPLPCSRQCCDPTLPDLTADEQARLNREALAQKDDSDLEEQLASNSSDNPANQELRA